MDFVFQCIFTARGVFLSFILTLLFIQNGRQTRMLGDKMDEGFRRMDEGLRMIANLIVQEESSTRELIAQETASTRELIKSLAEIKK